MISRFSPTSQLRHYVVARVAQNVGRDVAELNKAAHDMAFRRMVWAPNRLSKIPSLTVTAFMTQYDERRQIEDFLQNRERPETLAMQAGTKAHANLEAVAGVNLAEAASPSLGGISVSVDENELFQLIAQQGEAAAIQLSAKDCRFIDYYNKILALTTMHDEALKRHQIPGFRHPPVQVREIPVYGTTNSPQNFELRGIVDGLEIDFGYGLTVVETKTTQRAEVSPALLLLAYHQALIYRHVLEILIKEGRHGPEPLLNRFRISNAALRELMMSEPLKSRFEQVHRTISQIGFSPKVKIDILVSGELNEFTMDYDSRVLDEVFRSRLDLFTNKRAPFASDLARILQSQNVV